MIKKIIKKIMLYYACPRLFLYPIFMKSTLKQKVCFTFLGAFSALVVFMFTTTNRIVSQEISAFKQKSIQVSETTEVSTTPPAAAVTIVQKIVTNFTILQDLVNQTPKNVTLREKFLAQADFQEKLQLLPISEKNQILSEIFLNELDDLN